MRAGRRIHNAGYGAVGRFPAEAVEVRFSSCRLAIGVSVERHGVVDCEAGVNSLWYARGSRGTIE